MANKVCIVGSGNWGSAIATIVGRNCAESDLFDNDVSMWVFEEDIDGKKLSEIINERHENVKYLPGVTIPSNVRAVTDLVEATKGANLLVIVLPHQFIKRACQTLAGRLEPNCHAIHLIKGFELKEDYSLGLISDTIRDSLNIEVAALMGANIAHEVAAGKFGESTIASRNAENGRLYKTLFQTPWFRCTVIEDVVTTELCGALKNIVAVAAGFVDGLNQGDNTKAAVIRLGLMEMVAFCKEFYNRDDKSVFLESCGIADLVTTCYGGRHRKVAEAHVTTGKSFEQLEAEMLNGQILQGPQTAKKVYEMMKSRGIDANKRFPLFAAVYKVCYEGMAPSELFTCIQEHPEHM